MQILVERMSEDGLSRERWRFDVIAGYASPKCEIWVQAYASETRPSKRHRIWDIVASYAILRRHAAQSHVPLPDDVKAEAIEKLLERVEWVVR